MTGRVATGTKPCGILGAAGHIWVSDFGDDNLRTVDPRTLAVGKPVKVGDEPCGLAVGAGSLWVEDYGSDQVTRVDVRNGRVEHTYRVGASPYDVAFAGGAAWVTDYADGTVSRIDASSGRVSTIRVGGTPTGIAPAGGRVWVGAGSAGIVAIDVASGRVVQRLSSASGAGWTAYDARRVWIDVTPQVWELDAATGRVLARTRSGEMPEDGSVLDGVAWVPDGDGSIRRYGPHVSPHPIASGVQNPFVLATYRGAVWVVDFNGTDVVRIDPSRVG